MTPELQRAIRLINHEHFDELVREVKKIDRETRSEFSARGMLRSGAYVEAALSRRLTALEAHVRAVAETSVALSAKGGQLRSDSTRAAPRPRKP